MSNQYIKAKELRRELIKWNIINSLLAGGLVFAGALADGRITWSEMLVTLGAAFAVAVTKFREFWLKSNPTQNTHAFSFIH